jgi:hypothetical protein
MAKLRLHRRIKSTHRKGRSANCVLHWVIVKMEVENKDYNIQSTNNEGQLRWK